MNTRLEAIRRVLDHDTSPLAKDTLRQEIDKGALQKEIKSKAPDLHDQVQKLHDLLQHKSLGGKIDLGTDPEKINWDAMPHELAACFKPEFDYQPEDITAFTITASIDKTNEGNTIDIDLKRQGSWWSYAHTGAIVRKDYISGTASIGCKSNEGQPKAAREAMEQLDERLWQNDLTRGSADKQLPFIVHSVNELRFAEAVFEFTVNELERRVLSKTK